VRVLAAGIQNPLPQAEEEAMSSSSDWDVSSGQGTRSNQPRTFIGAVLGLACLVLLGANGCPPQTIQETKLLASDLAGGDGFGASVSLADDVALVGAYWIPRRKTGSAYVYRFDGTRWAEEAKLLPSDGNVAGFGISVSLSGNVALVGDSGLASTLSTGSAYVYRFDGNNWVEEAKFLPSHGSTDPWFGWSVSVSGDVALVGRSAYVYRFDGARWVEEANLLPSDRFTDTSFGMSVSVSGDVAVVGAHGNDDNGSDSGSAYVYRFNGRAWRQRAKLLPSDGAAEDYFGRSVSVSGDVALVGAYGDDDRGSQSGSAYVYRFDGTNWIEEAKLLASDGHRGDWFGSSVSVFGDVAVVGARYDVHDGCRSGSAYVYRFDGTNWIEEAKLSASDRASNDHFGISVSVWDNMALVGADEDEVSGVTTGSASLFSPLDGTTACSDGWDNDGDGLIDRADTGCTSPGEMSERSRLFECDDGIDNDGDGRVDFDPLTLASPGDQDTPPAGVGDPGCRKPGWSTERSQCQDGIDNDGDGLTDFDAGAWANGRANPAGPDPDCVGRPYRQCEAPSCVSCGLGAELPLLLPLLAWLRRRVRARA